MRVSSIRGGEREGEQFLPSQMEGARLCAAHLEEVSLDSPSDLMSEPRILRVLPRLGGPCVNTVHSGRGKQSKTFILLDGCDCFLGMEPSTMGISLTTGKPRSLATCQIFCRAKQFDTVDLCFFSANILLIDEQRIFEFSSHC